jgi:hypothetical protein
MKRPAANIAQQEVVDASESPPQASRYPSPLLEEATTTETFDPWSRRDPLGAKVAFPFNTASCSISTATLVSLLPNKEEARTLMDYYYRHFSWQ